MKKLFPARSASAGTVLSLLLMAVLTLGLWVATAPAVRAARTMTPTEMIQETLPPGRTMSSATKPEFLSAVCGAAKKHRPESSQITRVAVATHHDYAGDIVATVLRCSSSEDCEFVQAIVRAAIVAAPGEASVIDDAALALAPHCADAIQAAFGDGKEVLDGKELLPPAEGPLPPAEGPGDFQGAPTGQLPLPGLLGGGGGGFNPQIDLVTVCSNGIQRSVRQDQLAEFLSSHPGSSVGVCQPMVSTTMVCDNGTQRSVRDGDLADFLRSHIGAFVGSCQPTPVANR